MSDLDDLPIVRRYEIYPEPTYMMLYLGEHVWLCEACVREVSYTPKEYEGPNICPHCGVKPFFIGTTLEIRERELKIRNRP